MKYIVQCDDYQTSPYPTHEQAQRVLTAIEDNQACTNEHSIVEVDDSHRRRYGAARKNP